MSKREKDIYRESGKKIAKTNSLDARVGFREIKETNHLMSCVFVCSRKGVEMCVRSCVCNVRVRVTVLEGRKSISTLCSCARECACEERKGESERE